MKAIRRHLRVAILCTARGLEVPRDTPGSGFRLAGHRVQWRVGPRPVADPGALRSTLAAIAEDRSTWVADPTGLRRPLPVLVEPGEGTTYGDVTATLDAVAAAGFAEVGFARGR